MSLMRMRQQHHSPELADENLPTLHHSLWLQFNAGL
jgi:hypothetical protein